MPSGTPPNPTLALLLVVSVVTGGCIASTLNNDQLERRLGRQLSDRLGVPGIVATCPEDIEAHRGATFGCTARAPNAPTALRIDVTQIDDDGNVSWEIVGAAG